ncbi:MAG: methionyl-tRNA formyltransferase [Candidatus Eisenbacteria bacterium]
MGTPAFAVPALGAVAATCEVALVVTQPDRPRGRGREVAESEVSEAARALRLEVWKPADMRSADVSQRLRVVAPDLFAVVAFGAILSPDLLQVPRLGAVNLHGSLLPDFRGAAPVQRALWEGRGETGVSTLFMDEGIDTGDVILTRAEGIAPEDDAGTLATRLAAIGAPLLAESLGLAFTGRAPRTPQDRAAGSYAKKLRKSDGVVDWALDAVTVWNHQRAVTPWPGATTTIRGTPLTLVRTRPLYRAAPAADPGRVVAIRDGVTVSCGSGTLSLERVKPSGRAEMDAADWARGARIEVGDRLGEWGEVPA